MGRARREFWAQHPGLVWSNPDAEDAIFIRAALVHPRFSQLLAIIVEFGLARVKAEWAELCEEGALETQRARPIITRILKNIEEGFAIVEAGH